MKQSLWLMFSLIIVGLSGCGTTPPNAIPPDATLPNTVPPDATPPAATPPLTLPPTAVSFPSPLFPTAWDDREPFRAGLIPAAQSILDGLPGATIYHLDVTLSDDLLTVAGQEALRYTNQETVSLAEVYFHLFPNLLDSQMRISQVQVNGTAVTAVLESALDSLLRVPLPQPIAPGETAVITLEFVTAVPAPANPEELRNYGILALVDNILALAHFYPQVSVYDANGWTLETPVAQGDVTYSDSSFYLVRLNAPADLTIVASGIEQTQESANGRQTLTYALGPARDFYLAASPDYVAQTTQVGDCTIRSYAPAAYADGSAYVLEVASQALQVYNQRFVPYPYTELDLVSTPTLALGIEYPGIIANALRIYDLDGSSSSGIPFRTYLESTTAHEVGHQWFYNLIGNDQLNEPWLDEAITQYATWLYFQDTYGPSGRQGFADSLLARWQRVENQEMPIGLPVSAYVDAEYSAIVYGRGPLFLDALAQEMGQAQFDAFLREYVRQYQWQLVTTADFRALAEQQCQADVSAADVSACDLTDLFAGWVYP